MNNKNLIIISAIIVVLIICTGLMIFNNMNAEIEYEVYTVNGTGTTIEIPINSKIVETDELINITSERVTVLIHKDVNESKTALMAANTDIMDEKLNNETKELVQVFSYDEEARNHIIESVKFGKAIKNDKEETTEDVTEEAHVEVENTPAEVEDTDNNFKFGEQPDGSYIDPYGGDHWPSYDAYLYTYNNPSEFEA